MCYVDGFVVPIPKARLEEYRQMAELACKVWMEHGALAPRLVNCLNQALALDFPVGVYCLQAAIAACHARGKL